METLNYTTITSNEQYEQYCSKLKILLADCDITGNYDAVELLTFLIEKWNQEHSSFEGLNPIELLKSMMLMHKLKSKHLVDVLGVSKELIADLLNYKKGLSKENIQILSKYFSLPEEAFNRPYKLKKPLSGRRQKNSIITTHK